MRNVGLQSVLGMDDHSSVAPHVRHTLEGPSVVMPPPVLLPFVFGGDWDGDAAGELSRAFRCRCPVRPGATWHPEDLLESDRVGIWREVDIYKESSVWRGARRLWN